MQEPRLLAVDVGTSSCRAVLYGRGGQVLEAAAAPCPPVDHPEPDWAEQSADGIWATLVEVLQALMRNPGAAGRIAAMAVTAQIGTVCTDADGVAVHPVINWMDKRAAAEAAWVAARVGEEAIYAASGKRLDAERDACRLLWLQRNRPEAWRRVRWTYSLKDYLVHRLSGRAITDPIHASYTLLSDTASGDWNAGLCQALGIDLKLLPPILPATAVVGQVSSEIAQVTGLPVGLPVAVGGPDGSLGTLGAGLANPGDAVLVMGTSDVFFVCNDRRVSDPDRGILAHPHVLPDRWLIGGPQGLSGGAIKWLADQLRVGMEAAPGAAGVGGWAAAEQEALALPPGADRLLALPALVGERAPVWEPHWRGALIGLTPSHGAPHLIRAFAEGLAYGTERFVQRLGSNGCFPQRILAVGGGTRSALRPQITADVTGLEVACLENSEATSAGVAMCAGIAAGVLDFEGALRWSRVGQIYQPNPAAREAHRSLYPVWARWQEAQRATYEALAANTPFIQT